MKDSKETPIKASQNDEKTSPPPNQTPPKWIDGLRRIAVHVAGRFIYDWLKELQ